MSTETKSVPIGSRDFEHMEFVHRCTEGTLAVAIENSAALTLLESKYSTRPAIIGSSLCFWVWILSFLAVIPLWWWCGWKAGLGILIVSWMAKKMGRGIAASVGIDAAIQSAEIYHSLVKRGLLRVRTK